MNVTKKAVTPEERHEVAARLREYPIALLIALQKTVKSKALAELGELMRIAGVDQGNPEELFTRLADLIDPTCTDFGGEEGTNGEGYDFACSACGWCGDAPQPNYCPYCGARVVSIYE